MTKKEYARKPRKCPSCQSSRVATILTGMPAMNEKLEQDIKDGRVILGGCAMTEDDPYWQCADCSTLLYKKETAPKHFEFE